MTVIYIINSKYYRTVIRIPELRKFGPGLVPNQGLDLVLGYLSGPDLVCRTPSVRAEKIILGQLGCEPFRQNIRLSTSLETAVCNEYMNL